MKGVWYVGRVRGIPIQIHWSFCLILLWSAYIGYENGGWSYVGFAVFLTILLFACVLLHELGHALTAKLFGIGTRSITMLPIGGVAALNRIPERPREEFLITIAGPMVNVVIAGILYLFVGWPVDESLDPATVWNIQYFGYMLLYTNLVMAIFNMLPAFPMDGGRLVRAFLAMWLPHYRATAIASGLGRFMALVMIVLGVFTNPFLILIGIMVYTGARNENQWVALKSQLDGYTAGDFMQRAPAMLPLNSSIRDGVRALYTRGQGDFVVMDGPHVAGVISRELWLRHLIHDDGDVNAGDVMTRSAIVLAHDMPAFAMCRLVLSSHQSIYPCVNRGQLEGVISRETVHDLMRGNVKPSGKGWEGTTVSPPRSFMDVG